MNGRILGQFGKSFFDVRGIFVCSGNRFSLIFEILKHYGTPQNTATMDIFIELPPEDAEPGLVGKLEKSRYGTRCAALNWAEACTKVRLAMGYKKGL